ncbi:MAG: hypothetical protein JXJ17_07985 [Anaerolineae bacterium]|nr:hypothetical protein [Anaerolineae bacterium]
MLFVRAGQPTPVSAVRPTPTPTVDEAALAAQNVTPTPTAVSVQPTVTPTFLPVSEGQPEGEDYTDVLLLYDSYEEPGPFDTNYCMIAEFYGLICKEFDVRSSGPAWNDLFDEQGKAYSLIGISGNDLNLLDEWQVDNLVRVVENYGANLLVYQINIDAPPETLDLLSSGGIVGASFVDDTEENWFISNGYPEITQELTGMTFDGPSDKQRDFALSLDNASVVNTIISSENTAGKEYAIFSMVNRGAGTIFFNSGDAGSKLTIVPMRTLYYIRSQFMVLTPLMMAMRYAAGDEVWHNEENVANLTLDDPALVDNYGTMDYRGLLTQMQEHNFHTTIAFIPEQYQLTDLDIAQIFIDNPDRYSLVQHGNSIAGYEFYYYEVPVDSDLPARPLYEQIADINEGLRRMEELERQFGVTYDRVMIFPWGISPEQSLVELKRYNYLATVNGQDVPLDRMRPTYFSYGMYQANMDYASFAVLWRRYVTGKTDAADLQRLSALDLFIGKPLLLFSHAYPDELFSSSIEEFNPMADAINSLAGEDVEWKSLGDIIRHLYLRKTNDDGSIDVMMYGNNLIFDNDSEEDLVFYVKKVETLNVPISQVTVNGTEVPYEVVNDELIISMTIPAGGVVDIFIEYGD